MITNIVIKLAFPDKTDFSTNRSSLMHGVISEIVSNKYAEKMHLDSLHPYSQFLFRENDRFYWRINALDDEARINIIDVLSGLDEIYIRHNDCTICLEEKTISQISADNLFIKYGLNQPERKTEMLFISPTAFKSHGNYINIPSPQLILQSIVQKYDMFSGNALFSEELMHEVSDRVIISSYNLKSCFFPLEGIKIPAFTGKLTLYVKGGGALPGIVRMLGEYAKYSGVGIKTALGMGAVTIKTKGEVNE